MLQSWINRTVDYCIRYFRGAIAVGLVLAAASAVYAARHFAIDTDINDLLSAKLPWRQQEIAFRSAFSADRRSHPCRCRGANAGGGRGGSA